MFNDSSVKEGTYFSKKSIDVMFNDAKKTTELNSDFLFKY